VAATSLVMDMKLSFFGGEGGVLPRRGKNPAG